MRRTASLAAGSFLDRVADFVNRNIPDPRNDPRSTNKPPGYENFSAAGLDDAAGKPGQTLSEYLLERNKKWAAKNAPPGHVLPPGMSTREDGSLFNAGDATERGLYMTIEQQNEALSNANREASTVDEEKRKLRKQLQMENEEEFRKFMSEARRSELQEQATQKRRMPHPSDPNYDPFKITPGYRPQDSSKLASWLDRQRKSGKAHTGASMATPEGQERFYNEEKMATQYHANPFANRIEVPRGVPKIEIAAMSPDSFFIQEQEIIGSIIATPTRVYHWNASTFEDLNKRTLSVLLHLYPVPEVVFLGTGRNLYHIDEDLRIEFMKRGTVVHCLTTKEAVSTFGLQLTYKRRVAVAALACVPTNPYGRECFGDFIDNDAYCLSDTALGIRPPRQFNPYLYKANKVAEQYRHMQGSGYGPRYKQLPDGRLVRPGTSGTKLRPMLEPNQEPDWEKLPSYYNWFPKERMEDYTENTTYREISVKITSKQDDEKRLETLHRGKQAINRDEDQPTAEIMPWDSASIPLPKWQYERNEENMHMVTDPKTGRVIGMNRKSFNVWRQMMKDRADGKVPDNFIEFDQERIVSDNMGRLHDTAKAKYVPVNEGKWHPQKSGSSGKPNQQWG